MTFHAQQLSAICGLKKNTAALFSQICSRGGENKLCGMKFEAKNVGRLNYVIPV